MVTLVSAPGLAVFLVARSSFFTSFFTSATAGIKPLNRRAPNRIRFISDVVPFSFLFLGSIQRAPRGPARGKPHHVPTRLSRSLLNSCDQRPAAAGIAFLPDSRASTCSSFSIEEKR